VIRIGKRGEPHRRGLRNTANIYGIDGVNSGVSGATDPSLRPKIMADPRRDSAVDLLEVKYNMFLTEANVLVFYGQNRS
jgi:NifB/MoaA-like Fe-S oxidoreductase